MIGKLKTAQPIGEKQVKIIRSSPNRHRHDAAKWKVMVAKRLRTLLGIPRSAPQQNILFPGKRRCQW
ncbi:MAG: hypothetical protein WA117_06135 [Verrucomicrobiia bacterium]